MNKDKKSVAVINKCSKDGLCDELINSIDETGTGKGIKVLRGITHEQMFSSQFHLADARIFAVFYKTSAKDKGILFNFCPFCGEKFDWLRRQSKEIKE